MSPFSFGINSREEIKTTVLSEKSLVIGESKFRFASFAGRKLHEQFGVLDQ